MRTTLVLALALATTACRHQSDLYCASDTDCTDPSRPHCDLTGTTPASDGIGHTCVPSPVDAGASDAAVDAGPQVQLTVMLAGVDGGGVISTPPSISCGDTCTALFPAGTTVHLTVTTSSGIKFVDWTGACSGTSPTCDVFLDAPATTTASFDIIRVVQIVAGGFHSCALLDTGDVRCWGK
jgi:hypothetical protein